MSNHDVISYYDIGYQVYSSIQQQLDKVKSEFSVQPSLKEYLSLLRGIDKLILPTHKYKELSKEGFYSEVEDSLAIDQDKEFIWICDTEFKLNLFGYPCAKKVCNFLDRINIGITPGIYTSISVMSSIKAFTEYGNENLDWYSIARSNIDLRTLKFLNIKKRNITSTVEINAHLDLPEGVHQNDLQLLFLHKLLNLLNENNFPYSELYMKGFETGSIYDE